MSARSTARPSTAAPASDPALVLGSGQFIPGFEEQLVGAKAGDEKQITVTFPENYRPPHLAGKEATFDVTVKEVARPGRTRDQRRDGQEARPRIARPPARDRARPDREPVRPDDPPEGQAPAARRSSTQRYKFEAPSKLVEAEFNNIWAQVEPRPRGGRAHLRRRGHDGRGGPRRVQQARRAPRAPRPGACRDRREGRRAGDRRGDAARAVRDGPSLPGQPAAGDLRVLPQQSGRADQSCARRSSRRRWSITCCPDIRHRQEGVARKS